MNKISKQKLKQIVKECIVEILAEGLGQELSEGISHARQSKPLITQKQQPPVQSSMPPRPALLEAVKEVAAGDTILKGILADTAATTFQEQSKYTNPGGDARFVTGGSKEELAVAATTPEEIFGSEVLSKWEDLAFASPAKKLQ